VPTPRRLLKAALAMSRLNPFLSSILRAEHEDAL